MRRDGHGVGFSSPPRPVELELSGLAGVTLPSLGLAGTSICPLAQPGSYPATAGTAGLGLCESSRWEPSRRAETNPVTSNS